MNSQRRSLELTSSLPAWGAWVGIPTKPDAPRCSLVAPRMGSVGWNIASAAMQSASSSRSPHGERGLEYLFWHHRDAEIRSLPAWGAWVGIVALFGLCPLTRVAPRMGSVGWNSVSVCALRNRCRSLPAWGAWVGISMRSNIKPHLESLPAWGAWVGITPERQDRLIDTVAPRMGSVGWNTFTAARYASTTGRSPHGERGLEL